MPLSGQSLPSAERSLSPLSSGSQAAFVVDASPTHAFRRVPLAQVPDLRTSVDATRVSRVARLGRSRLATGRPWTLELLIALASMTLGPDDTLTSTLSSHGSAW